MGEMQLGNYWLSWYHPPDVGFELDWPWWHTGERCSDGYLTVCAAVREQCPEAAKGEVLAAMDHPVSLEWRFCSPMPNDWQPFSDRFPRASWMKWPQP